MTFPVSLVVIRLVSASQIVIDRPDCKLLGTSPKKAKSFTILSSFSTQESYVRRGANIYLLTYPHRIIEIGEL